MRVSVAIFQNNVALSLCLSISHNMCVLSDIYPPEIDATDALFWCSNKIFPTPNDAIECFTSLVTAVDDCKGVKLTVTESTVTVTPVPHCHFTTVHTWYHCTASSLTGSITLATLYPGIVPVLFPSVNLPLPDTTTGFVLHDSIQNSPFPRALAKNVAKIIWVFKKYILLVISLFHNIVVIITGYP